MHKRRLAPSHWAGLALLMGLASTLIFAIWLTCHDEPNIHEIMGAPAPAAPYENVDKTEIGETLDELWASTVYIGREQKPGINIYVASGWVLGSKNDMSYIATAAHALQYRPDLKLKIGYFDKNRQWSVIDAGVIRRLDGRQHGDCAILSCDRVLPALKLARTKTYASGDEIFISGTQYNAPPSIVTTGVITSTTNDIEFRVKGWAWHGFSGGPIMLRKTGEVIGFIAWSVPGHNFDAMLSDCGTFTAVNHLLRVAKLESILTE